MMSPAPRALFLFFAAPVSAVVVAWLIARRSLPSLRPLERVLSTRWAAVVVGILTFITFRYAWGSFNRLPIIHDEAAYVLQARLFAAGRWGDRTPIPEFFEQPYLLVTPKLAEKY